MNYFKICLVLFAFIFCSSACYSDSSLPGKNSTLKWAPTSPSAISEKANKTLSIGETCPITGAQDPFVQGVLNGYYNTMQGMSGGSYSAQELQKQQADYAKQQQNYSGNEE